MATTNESKRIIAKYAFEKLRRDKKFDAAMKLASSLIWGEDSIGLGISDIDTEIEHALNHCMGDDLERNNSPYHTLYYPSYKVMFSFNDDVEITLSQFEKNRIEFID